MTDGHWATGLCRSVFSSLSLTVLTFCIAVFLVRRWRRLLPDAVGSAVTLSLGWLVASEGRRRWNLLVLHAWRGHDALAEVVWWPGVTVTVFHAVSTQDWDVKPT